MHPLLADYPLVIQQPVDWGDMDAYKHVNNVVYFRYLENARLAYLERLDWKQVEKETGVGPIVGSIQARFRRAVTYPDSLWVGARVREIKEDRFTMDHRIISEKLGDWTTEGQCVVVAFSYELGQKAPLPPELRRRIEAFERRE